MDTLVNELLGGPPSGRLTVVMIYGFGGESLDRKRVRDDLDGSSGCAILACGRHTGCGLHGICFYRYECKIQQNGKIQNAGVQDGGQIRNGWGVREWVAIKPSIYSRVLSRGEIALRCA